MHQKRHFPRSGVLTIFLDLGFVPGRRDLYMPHYLKSTLSQLYIALFDPSLTSVETCATLFYAAYASG